MKPVHDIESGRLSGEQISENYCDLHPRLTALQAQAESARCYFCHDAPCIEACPTSINIPAFIRKISTGNVKGAAVDILSANIMGATCANVCPVEELCEEVCVRQTAEHKPVTIGRLQRYATDYLFESGEQPFQRAAASGQRVAVVGAGPAGLSCAHRLAMHGHEVDVFEAREKAGGLNEYGLAAYKMLDERAAREVAFILDIGGIHLHTGRALGRDLQLPDLRREYDAVFLGLGHNAVNQLRLEQENVPGVENAVDYIARIRQDDPTSLPVGRRVVVIGAGNTAVDIAVQIKKLGAAEVTMVYRRGESQMGATWYEQEVAQTNGVVIKTWARPVRLLTDDDGVTGVVFETTQLDEEGQLHGTGEEWSLAADMVFKAIGQHFDENHVFADGDGLEIEGRRIVVDEACRTSLHDVFAGGDCIPGKDLTVAAVEDGKIAAEAIHQQISKEVTHG